MASGEMVAWQRERVRWLRSKGEGERSWCGKWKERWWRSNGKGRDGWGRGEMVVWEGKEAVWQVEGEMMA